VPHFNVHSVTVGTDAQGEVTSKSSTAAIIPRPWRLRPTASWPVAKAFFECDQSHHRHRRPATARISPFENRAPAGHDSGHECQPVEDQP